jgi:TonB-dependent SusC/RagA subfamily outer membrane receptor
MLAGNAWRRMIAAVFAAGCQVITAGAVTSEPVPPPFAGTVIGRVTEARSEIPLASVSVEVEGLRLQTTTGVDGRYRLSNVPAGTHVLIARRIGYGAERRTITVTDNQQATADFAMQVAAIALDEFVVTGTAGGEVRRAIGNSVVTINAPAELERSAAQNLGTLLQSRAAGVIITPNNGRIGAGPTIQVRGRSSLSLSSEPIIYIDGVRVNNAVNTGPGGAAGLSLASQNSQTASRLNDIDPEDIESIEVIKGPAAATIYGTEAANGVIQIITKKGSSGNTQWTAKIEQGALWFRDAADRIPVNYARDPASGQIVAWDPIGQEKARGTPIFKTGHTQSYNLALSGARDIITYYLSTSFNDDEGIEPNNSGKNFSGHASMNISSSPKLDIATSLHYFRGTAHLGADGGLSPMLGLSIGHPINNPTTRGFFFAPPEVPQQLYDNVQDINRYTAGTTISHRPLNWFSQRLTLGLDYTSEDSRGLERFAPPELRPFFTAAIGGPVTGDGRIAQTLRNDTYITADYAGTASFDLTSSIRSSSSLGGQFIRKQLKNSGLSGIVFPGPGVETVSGTTTPGTPTQSLTVNTTIGAYVQQQFGWNDRRFITAAVRVDNNSAFGEDFDLITYPKLAATWVISEEPFWTGLRSVVSGLKLRSAYGQSGQAPNAFTALRTVTNAPRANGTAGVTPGSLGNPDLKPERGTELEVGFEAGLFDRLSLDLTYYTRRTKDAILSRDLAPSSGFSGNQIVNIGETSNRGLELLARLQAITRDNLTWEIAGNISTNKDEIEDMGGVPPGTGILRNVEGFPIGGFWTKRIASADRDPTTHAITNVLCENGPPSNGTPVPCAQAFAVFAGTPTPKVTGGVANTFTILRRLTLYGFVDFKQGHKLLNANDANRCGLNVCEARFFPERYSTEYLAGITASSITAGVQDQFIQDASFVKLRELSATYRIPEGWLGRTGISSANIVVAGRNLATWSDYAGIDPEVRYQGTTPQDQGLTPALTQFVTSLVIRF